MLDKFKKINGFEIAANQFNIRKEGNYEDVE